ncbi:transcription-repair coupling factor [Hydrogenovibrio kuenenii]|uniref:transcription-repair coupling factor n=1 Tax=Hydrogenovibrio kuenenii TaxID=63658 RepID=UPI000463D0A1|nr:transcription-repair coupling factor [Hydrogenovibrio kuenenii]
MSKNASKKTPSLSLNALINLPLKGQRSYWQVSNLAETAWALSEKIKTTPSLAVFLTASTREANSLEEAVTFFAGDDFPILNFPDWETLPYDQFSPHQDIISQRLKTLHQLPSVTQGLLILPVSTLLQKVVPHQFIDKYTFFLKTQDTVNVEAFNQQLETGGYQRVNQVVEPGEFAVRGSLIDVFPMGSKTPFRLDLFDDEIESIRSFDPENQRTLETIEQIELLPAKEYDLSESGIHLFRQNFRNQFGEDARHAMLYKAVSEQQTMDGLEYYLPLFHETLATLFDYLPEDSLFFDSGNIGESIQATWNDYQERYQIAQHNPDYPVLPPATLISNESDTLGKLKQFHRITFETAVSDKTNASLANMPMPDLSIQNNADYPLAKLNAFIDRIFDSQTTKQTRLLYCAESTGRRETLLTLLKKEKNLKLPSPTIIDSWQEFANSNAQCSIVVGPLEDSFYITENDTSGINDICIISEAQIFGETVVQRRRRKQKHSDFDSSISNLIELEIGNPIVHIDHGVGRYQGLITMNIQGEDHELLCIEYADEAKLYVPVTSLHLISRYTGASAENAPLHKIGSDRWKKAKKKAAEKVHDVAAELLDIYAQREARPGFAFETDEQAYARFCAGFPFEETPDQEAAIEAVLADMLSPRPMDRLVCGDVGFGKTEVAMRAAFIAAYSGKQVAILVPTTLLSQQHLENFQNRFADWPIKIEGLSRFQSAKDTQRILENVKNGDVDIIIGTHKLIQNDMKFNNLGLIIIDEEHRFGVRQKEQLKKMRTEVDVMTMTATPIPRTLNMAMNDLRDLSIIATAPEKRLAVQTFVQDWNPDVVKEACLREIRRGGQIYLLFNNVEKIDHMVEEMQALLPEASVRSAHGQMNERELEHVMQDFYHRRFNILVCTTIIETGIDIPTANTILIHRADKFGLAQLHQLRGRVGRSHHKAYAYLFTAGKSLMTKDAEKRLAAIAKHDTLGAGFMLASHDLEIRGAGELLGDGQSGQIQEIGFGLYTELLDRAVRALKSGKQPELDTSLHHGTEVELGVPSLIPEDYLPDIHTRLVFYKRIAGAKDTQSLRELEVEMIDRFGLLPDQVKNLFAATSVKLLVEPLNLVKVEAHDSVIRIQFGSSPNIDPLKLIQLIQRQPKNYQLKGQTELKYFDTMPETVQRIQAIELIIASIKAN